MRKIIQNIALFSLVAFFLASCSKICDYPFLHPAEEITDIRIGIIHDESSEVGELLAENAVKLETIAILPQEQWAAFLEDLSSVTGWTTGFGPPPLLYTGHTVVYIQYQNGDFELIHFSSCGVYAAPQGIMSRMLFGNTQFYSNSGGYCLDENAFNALIDQTLSEIEEVE